MEPIATLSPEQIAAEEAAIAILEARALAQAGITANHWSDQGSNFDIRQIHDEIARRKAGLAGARRGTTTRYGAVSKGV